MQLEIQHVEIHVSSLEKAKAFYAGKLELEILDEMPELNLLALKAGKVRISIFGGYEPNLNAEKQTGTHLIFRTQNLTETIEKLKAKGVTFTGDVFEAPVRRTILFTILAGGAATLLSVLLAMWAASRIAAPIKQIE